MIGIASIVNIKEKNHPIVFIEIDYYKRYIDELNNEFPCHQALGLGYRERRNLIKENRKSLVLDVIKKKLRCSNEQDVDLPDLNEDLNSDDNEEGTSH